MKNNIFVALLGWFMLLNYSCEKSEDLSNGIEVEILKEMETERIPSVVACVVEDGEIMWEGAFGYSNENLSTPATRQSLFTLMSITKLFLATTVMQLWEMGMIDLEEDINQYLPFEVRNPHFPNQKITPYMLLTHSSGLAWPTDEDEIPDFHHFYTNEEPPLISEWLPEYILPEGSQYRPSIWKNFKPGEKWLYSNIGTSLLALIVEQISGDDYRDFCRKNILEPLEMDNSAFKLSDLNKELLVTPYTGNNHPMAYYTCRHYPAGFLSTNIEDFSHFAIAILNYGEFKGKRILQKSTIEKMLEIQNPASGVSLLWWHFIGDCVGHAGGGTGFSTWAEWHFNSDKAMFIFSNKVNESISPGGRIYELVRYQYSRL
jgi:CubicO group peptidase (beta-lactamase class C family)